MRQSASELTAHLMTPCIAMSPLLQSINEATYLKGGEGEDFRKMPVDALSTKTEFLGEAKFFKALCKML